MAADSVLCVPEWKHWDLGWLCMMPDRNFLFCTFCFLSLPAIKQLAGLQWGTPHLYSLASHTPGSSSWLVRDGTPIRIYNKREGCLGPWESKPACSLNQDIKQLKKICIRWRRFPIHSVGGCIQQCLRTRHTLVDGSILAALRVCCWRAETFYWALKLVSPLHSQRQTRQMSLLSLYSSFLMERLWDGKYISQEKQQDCTV